MDPTCLTCWEYEINMYFIAHKKGHNDFAVESICFGSPLKEVMMISVPPKPNRK